MYCFKGHFLKVALCLISGPDMISESFHLWVWPYWNWSVWNLSILLHLFLKPGLWRSLRSSWDTQPTSLKITISTKQWVRAVHGEWPHFGMLPYKHWLISLLLNASDCLLKKACWALRVEGFIFEYPVTLCCQNYSSQAFNNRVWFSPHRLGRCMRVITDTCCHYVSLLLNLGLFCLLKQYLSKYQSANPCMGNFNVFSRLWLVRSIET